MNARIDIRTQKTISIPADEVLRAVGVSPETHRVISCGSSLPYWTIGCQDQMLLEIVVEEVKR